MAKGDKFYFENLKGCAQLSHSAASYLVECLDGYDHEALIQMIEKMHDIEHSADKKKHEMNDVLIKAFVTPIDREDLDLLSQELDDVTDSIEEILQKFYIYDIKELRADAIEFAKEIVRSCELLDTIMAEFENFKKPKKIHELIIELNNIEEECDRLYLSCMRSLTLEESDVLLVASWRKIFECMEACADSCERVGECVRSVIMKNT